MATIVFPNIGSGGGFYEPPPPLWPAQLIPSEMSVGIVANNTAYENAFTKTLQVGELSNGRGYVVTVSAAFNGLNKQEVKQFMAFIASRRGQAKRFLFPLVAGTEPSSSQAANNPLNGFGNDGAVLAMATEQRLLCYAPNKPLGELVLKRGQWLSFEDNLGGRHATVATSDSTVFKTALGFGLFWLDLAAPIARLANQSRMLMLSNPSCEFVLNTDTEGAITQSPDGLFNAQVNMTSVRRLSVPVLNPLTPQSIIDQVLSQQ